MRSIAKITVSAKCHKCIIYTYDCLDLWPQCQHGIVDMVVFACVCQYLEFCDNVLVLEDGEVREAGDHQALMKANGRYAQLISNYQMEQSKVKSLQDKTQMCCSSAILTICLSLLFYYCSCKSFSPVLYCLKTIKAIKHRTMLSIISAITRMIHQPWWFFFSIAGACEL